MGEITETPADAEMLAAFDKSYRRVDAYLAALGLRSDSVRHDIAKNLTTVVAHDFDDADIDPMVSKVIDQLERKTLLWSRQIGHSTLASEEAFLHTRLAFLLYGSPSRLRGLFVSQSPWNEDFTAELEDHLVRAVPSFSRGEMRSRDLRLGTIPHLADVTLHKLEKTRWLRILCLWGFFLTFFSALFYFTR